jgi:peptidoglycan hydrolase-like protein with peptidoglycan-binding domain
VVGDNQRIVHLPEGDLTAAGIVGAIARAALPDGIPAAQIGPGKADRQDDGDVGFLENGMVDGDVGRRGAGVFIEPDEIEVVPGAGDGVAGRSAGVGCKAGAFVQKGRGAHHEHARIPQIVAIVQHLDCLDGAGLFNKAGNGAGRLGASAGLDVAIAGFGPCRHQSKGDQMAGAGGAGGLGNCGVIAGVG